MPTPRVRADYDALSQITQSFQAQAEATRRTLQSLKRQIQVLEGGDWIGQGATAFYQEMNGAVLPAMQRLGNALETAAQTTQQISQIIKQAEDDAARVLRGDGAGGAGGGAGGTATATKDAMSVLGGATSQKNAPAQIALPSALNNGMQSAWKDSFPGGHEQEQGGILVQTKTGDLKWIRGKAGTAGTWPPNYGDIGDNQFIGLGHTHPYDSGHTDVAFSDVDLSFLFKADPSAKQAEKMMMVQSGEGQFVVARTDEFNKMIAGKSQTDVDTLIAEMKKTYADARKAKKDAGGNFTEQIDAAVKAVSDKYQLVYYKGKSGALHKQ
jgi:WXG100 family type VII secretion target